MYRVSSRGYVLKYFFMNYSKHEVEVQLWKYQQIGQGYSTQNQLYQDFNHLDISLSHRRGQYGCVMCKNHRLFIFITVQHKIGTIKGRLDCLMKEEPPPIFLVVTSPISFLMPVQSVFIELDHHLRYLQVCFFGRDKVSLLSALPLD